VSTPPTCAVGSFYFCIRDITPDLIPLQPFFPYPKHVPCVGLLLRHRPSYCPPPIYPAPTIAWFASERLCASICPTLATFDPPIATFLYLVRTNYRVRYLRKILVHFGGTALITRTSPCFPTSFLPYFLSVTIVRHTALLRPTSRGWLPRFMSCPEP